MPQGLDIGALSGRIELEDRVSVALTNINLKLDTLETKFGSLGSRVAESAAGFLTAEAALGALERVAGLAVNTLKDLTIGGAGVADVADNFDNMTRSAGRLGETLLDELRAGTQNTIDDLRLMKMVNGDLAAGLKLSDEQFRVLADGAFALAQVTGGDVATSLETMNDALLTGRTRSVEMLTGKIDLEAAERRFAESINATVDQLSEEGKLEAKRLAILDSVAAATGRIGEQTSGLDEMVAQLNTQWTNWYNELGRIVATSPRVIGAFEVVRDSLVGAFGGDTRDMLRTAAGWIDNLADKVAEYAPIVVNAFVKTRDWVTGAWSAVSDAATTYGPIVVKALGEVRDFILDVWTATQATWGALPNWFKEAAKGSVLLAGGLVVLGHGGKGAIDAFDQLINISGNALTSLSMLPMVTKSVTNGFNQLKNLVAVMQFNNLANAGASLQLVGHMAAKAIGPIGGVALAVGAMFAAWELGKTAAVSDFFMDLSLAAQGFSKAEREAMIATDKATATINEQSAAEKARAAAAAEAARLQHELAESLRMNFDINTQSNPVLDRNRMILEATAEQLKKNREAWDEINSAGQSWQETLAGVDKTLVDQAKKYLDAGVSAGALATAYGLTSTQLKAVQESMQEEEKILKKNQESIRATNDLWREYAMLRKEHGMSMLDAQREAIKAWAAHEIENIKGVGQAWREHYDAIQAVAKEKLQAIAVDWELLRQHSRAALEDQAASAQATYEYALMHADQFTQGFIEGLRESADAARNAAYHWQEELGGALNKVGEDADRLKKKLDDLRVEQLRMGGQFNVEPLTEEQIRTQGGHEILRREVEALEQEFAQFPGRRPGGNGPTGLNPNDEDGWRLMLEKQVRYLTLKASGFRQGGVGDFGDGTLAVLHGKEVVAPFDKFMATIGGGNRPSGPLAVFNWPVLNDERTANFIVDVLNRKLLSNQHRRGRRS